MVHNGEIYNHQELRQSLTKGQVARTKSDSEIIVHLFEEKGTDCVSELDGVFSFIVARGNTICGQRPNGSKASLLW